MACGKRTQFGKILTIPSYQAANTDVVTLAKDHVSRTSVVCACEHHNTCFTAVNRGRLLPCSTLAYFRARADLKGPIIYEYGFRHRRDPLSPSEALATLAI